MWTPRGVTISCIDNTKTVLIASQNSGLYNCTITGATGAGGKLVSYINSTTGLQDFVLNNCILGSAETLVYLDGSLGPISILVKNCTKTDEFSTVNGFVITLMSV